MSTVSQSPLGNFEERLLLQLKAEVAKRPSPPETGWEAQPAMRFRAVRLCSRFAVPIGGAIAALVVAALSILPAAEPALARAFPILTHQAVMLPARYRQALRAQHLVVSSGRIAHDRAYGFRTPRGTGYVVVGPRDRWLCILIPAIDSTSAGIRCETARQLLQSATGGIRVITHHGNRTEIVELIRQGVAAIVIADGTRTVADNDGIIAITTNSSATITTTTVGKRSTITYRLSTS